MKPQYEPVNTEQSIAYFIEECGEALAAAGKTLRWGIDSYNPEIPPGEREINGDWLLREVRDVETAIARVRKFLQEDQ